MSKIVVFDVRDDLFERNRQYDQLLISLRTKQKERRKKRKIHRRKQQKEAQKARNHLFNTII
jgi:hypothetical protein